VICILDTLQLAEALHNRKMAGSISDGVLRFLLDFIFRAHYGTGVDSM
jgi:hypothetical protein